MTPHPVFSRRGDDLTLTVPITYPEAALGAQVPVPTPDGPVTLQGPGRHHQRPHLPGPRPRGPEEGRTAGDLLVTVEVAVPEEMTPEAREALERYAVARRRRTRGPDLREVRCEAGARRDATTTPRCS